MTRRNFVKLSLVAGASLAASPFLFKGEAHAAGGVVARFMVGSDVHVRNFDSEKKLALALAWAAGLSPVPDRICLVGDLVDNGTLAEYDALNAVIDAGPFSRDRFIFGQGNHETFDAGVPAAPERFKQCMGQEANKLLSVNGVPVVTMGPNTLSDECYVANLDFLKESLAAIDADPATYTPGAPIFMLCHHSIPNTVYASPEWNGVYSAGAGLDLTAEMKRYPQIVHISGHSHSTLEDARSIDQSLGFTCIQDSTLGAYFENERNVPHTMYDPDTGEVSSYPAFNGEASQCLIVDVMGDGSVEVQRWNLYPLMSGGEPYKLFETWTIDIPGMIAGVPTYLPTRASAAAPIAPAGEVSVADVGQDALTVRFPSFTAGSQDNADMVHHYAILMTPLDEQGNPAGDPVERRCFNDYYRVPSVRHESTGDLWQVRVTGLSPDATYRVEVRAETSFDENGAFGVSEAIGGVVVRMGQTQPVDTPAALLDIDYRTGSLEDACGHELKVYDGTLVPDAALGWASVKAVETAGGGGCSYRLEASDYPFFATQATAECLFKMVDKQADQCVFSNQQGAGAGFEVEHGRLEYWLNLEGGRVMPAAPIEADVWVHAVATYDGTTARLYIDGALANEVPASGAMTVPRPKTYFVGADTSSSETPEFLCAPKTRVAIARLYPRCMASDEVTAAYEATKLVLQTMVDEQTGVSMEGVASDVALNVEDASAAPRASLAENEVLIGSYDISLVDSLGVEVQPAAAVALVLPVQDGWVAQQVQVRVPSDAGRPGTADAVTVEVGRDGTVRLDDVRVLGRFDVVATKESEPGTQGGSGSGSTGSGATGGSGFSSGAAGGSAHAVAGQGSGSGGSDSRGTSMPKTGDSAPAAAAVAVATAGIAGAAATAAYAALKKAAAAPDDEA